MIKEEPEPDVAISKATPGEPWLLARAWVVQKPFQSLEPEEAETQSFTEVRVQDVGWGWFRREETQTWWT